ncbi:MAG: fimbrillin family protein [Muribaculaceae bacterium]|nr:fimbrillin family protein [Muribaculaceae bacterium]
MKKYNKYILRTIKVLMLSVFVASCSQDDVEQSMPLPDGQYPLDLTVSVEGMKSRAGGKDNWKDGDEIGVRIGSDKEIGRYTLNPDGSVNIEESANLLHWRTTSPATVQAWFPFEPQTDVSIADQSELSDFSSIDYLAATAENQNYKNTVGLTFKHQMAKVICVLRTLDSSVISDEELHNATVTFNGYTVATFAEGELSGDVFGKIVPIKNDRTHEALLVPADMAGQELFHIDFNVGGYDKSFSYIPGANCENLQPGKSYTFYVTLRRDKVVVNEISASWDGEAEEIFSEAIPLNVYFSDDLPEGFFDGYAEFSESFQGWDDEDECYKVKGNTFTISLTLDEDGGNFMKGFTVTEGIASVNRVRIENRHVFIFKVNTESVRLEYGDYMQVGDFLYTNGKWRPDIYNNTNVIGGGDVEDPEVSDSDLVDLNKNPNFGYGYDDNGEIWECIGVIFKVGPGNGDSVENYGGRLKTIHGYAVALHDVSVPAEIGNWGGGFDFLDEEMKFGVYDSYVYVYDGYTNTQNMLPIAIANKTLNDRQGEEAYWAFNRLNKYNETVKVPDYFSTWYIPSIGQLSDLYKFVGRRDRLVMAGGEELILSDVGIFPSNSVRFDSFGAKYWSSTQASRDAVWVFRFQTGQAAHSNKLGVSISSRSSLSRMRAVLTF